MELDKICQNCSFFISDMRDLEEGLGVCIEDKAFEPFIDEILEMRIFPGVMIYILKSGSVERKHLVTIMKNQNSLKYQMKMMYMDTFCMIS